MALTALKVSKQLPPGKYGDGNGLWLQVSQWGTKSWLYRYQIAGKARSMGLGAAEVVSLVEARDLAHEARRQIREGRDPIAARKAAKAQQAIAAASGMTFQDAAAATIAAHEGTWTNAEHRRQWKSSLEQYAYPILGKLPVAAIDTALVLKCLEPIWTTKRTTADRVRGRIESVLDWATARGYRTGDNPARWRGHLEYLLAGQGTDTVHLKALPYDALPEFLHRLRGREGVTPKALEFTILTAARTGEALGARWSEIDGSIWTVPAARMKGRREHRVPLSRAALALLKELPREGESVFIGARAGRPLHGKAMNELLEAMGVDATVHGFRSSFRDWAAECTAYPREVCEMALAHAIPSKVEASYRRGDLFEKRRRLMEDWAKYCAAPAAAKGSKVVALREGRHG
jgi:integrase